jgi:hypothetical protein
VEFDDEDFEYEATAAQDGKEELFPGFAQQKSPGDCFSDDPSADDDSVLDSFDVVHDLRRLSMPRPL